MPHAKPNIVRDRLLQAMAEHQGDDGSHPFAHPDGRPNKRAFARHLTACAGEDPKDLRKLENWHQNVLRWTRNGNSTGMSEDMARFVAECLQLDPDALMPETIYQQLVAERDRLERQVKQNTKRIELLEAAFQEFPGAPPLPAPESSEP